MIRFKEPTRCRLNTGETMDYDLCAKDPLQDNSKWDYLGRGVVCSMDGKRRGKRDYYFFEVKNENE